MAALPVQIVRCHAEPETGSVTASRRTHRLVTDGEVTRFAGSRGSWRRLRHSLGGKFAYRLTSADTTDLYEVVAGAETVRLNRTCGGIVFDWTHEEAALGQQPVQWVNHWDLTGRGLQTAHFFDVNGGGSVNPTQGGGSYGGQPAAEGRQQAAAYTDDDIVQGSPLLLLTHEQQKGGDTHTVSVRATPLDFELDSTFAEIVDNGGSGHDCFVYPTLEVGFDLTLNVAGLAGVHRWDGYLRNEERIGPSLSGQLIHAVHAMRHGFDKVYVWNGANPSGIRLDDREIVAALDELGIASIAHSEGSAEIVVTTDGTHGRAVGCSHNVTIANVTGTDAALVNGTHRVVFTSATGFAVQLASPITVEDLTGGDVSSPTALYYDKTQTNKRQMWVGQTNVEGGIGADDPGGDYFGHSMFDEEGWHALIFRADGTEPWSMAADFCVAIVGYFTSYYDQNRRIRLASWNNTAGSEAGTDSNAADSAHLIGCNLHEQLLGSGLYLPEWNGSTEGEHVVTSFLVLGSWSDVLERLALLDAKLTSGEIEPRGVPAT